MRKNSKALLVRGIALLLLSSTVTSTVSANTTMVAIDPAAHKVLNQMQITYTNLNSLSENVVGAESASVPYSLTVHTQIHLLRPGYVSIKTDSRSSRTGSSAVIVDGSYCYVTAPEYPSRYLKFPVPPSSESLQAALTENVSAGFTLALFSVPNFVDETFADNRLATLHLEKPVKINGATTDIVVSTDTDGASVTLYVGRADHLLKRAIVQDPNKPGTFTEDYSAVVTNAPLKAADFKFVPPPHTDPYYASSFNLAQHIPAQ